MAAESPYAIFRQRKIRDYAKFSKALGHTNRDWEVPNANNEVKNEYLVSTPLEQIKSRCESARTRSDNVLGYDLLFTASPEFFSEEVITGKKFDEWKNRTIEWIEQNFGGKKNIVNLAVHWDESTPHIACQTVAIHEGKLNAKHFTGGTRHRLSELQDSYAEAMAKFGLQRGVKGSLAKHESIKKYYARVNEAEASDQLQEPIKGRKAPDIEPVIEREPPDNGVFRKEDPAEYLTRIYYGYVAPYIQKILDENKELKKELQEKNKINANLQKEISHWRSARAWTKKQADKFKKMKSDLFYISRDRNNLTQDMERIKKINPRLVRAVQQEREERTR